MHHDKYAKRITDETPVIPHNSLLRTDNRQLTTGLPIRLQHLFGVLQ